MRTPPATGYCLVLSSDDGERSMGTYLGAAGHLDVLDLDPDEISSARSLYIEGYLFDSILGRDAVRAAIEIARASKKRVTLSLADSQCVIRNRELFRILLESKSVDVVFGNMAEFLALYPTIDAVRDVCARNGLWAAITIAEEGSIVCTAVESVQVPARSAVSVVDTTGAGDLYAAGFLLGLARELQPVACARLGSFAAARIIEQHGARPTESLKAEAVRLGLLPSMPAE